MVSVSSFVRGAFMLPLIVLLALCKGGKGCLKIGAFAATSPQFGIETTRSWFLPDLVSYGAHCCRKGSIGEDILCVNVDKGE